ncbi:Hypothetical predicted protein [Cloeon dipterum]|uniref:Uncharacterized protein n=1 Tax=Cloeon dipterum TaxID=197152 RepID=A0A8S1CW69_9INSE|nr:Hypothetical predicted protein [Cloeon dipterum]
MEELEFSEIHDEISDDFHRLKEQENVSHDSLLDFLRNKCFAKSSANSLKAFGIISSLINRVTLAAINLYDFSNMYPSEPDYEMKVLQLLAAKKAENIFLFAIYKEGLNRAAPLIDQSILTEITKFTNLVHIIINQRQFLLKDLMKMCENLLSLSRFHVVIDLGSELPVDDPQFVQKFSNSFDKIKEFVFALTVQVLEDKEKAKNFTGELTNFGVKHLPNLHRISAFGIPYDMSQGCKEMEKTSKLQYMRLSAIHLEEFASKFDKFPSVQTLVVSWNNVNDFGKDSNINKEKLKLLKEFTKINELRLTNMTSFEYLEVLLKNTGPKLKFLNLYCDTKHKMKVNLKQIQDTCPSLSTLEIHVDDVEETQSMVTFKSLKQLQIIYHTDSSEKVCLSNLLSPPNLEVVHLEGFQVTKQELQETTLKIQAQAILTKVNLIKLCLSRGISTKLKKAIKNECRLLVSAVQKMWHIDKESATFEFL